MFRIFFANLAFLLSIFSFRLEILHLLVISRVWPDETPQVGLLGRKNFFSATQMIVHENVQIRYTPWRPISEHAREL